MGSEMCIRDSLHRIRTTREKLEAEKKAKKKQGKTTGRSKKKKTGDTERQLGQDVTLLDILVNADRPLLIDELRSASGLPSGEFYSSLKDSLARGTIKEKVEKDERYLVAGK